MGSDEMNQSDSCWTKGLSSGLIGGFVGAIVMTQIQNAWSKAAQQMKSNKGTERQQQSGEQEKEDATMKAAGKVASLLGQELSHEKKQALGPVVHCGLGTLQGGLYGTVLELAEQEGGMLPALIFGAALFAAADEVAVPAAGLSGKPSETPLSMHLYALASHLVYGVATEIARRGLRASL